MFSLREKMFPLFYDVAPLLKFVLPLVFLVISGNWMNFKDEWKWLLNSHW